jgi:hypothetical protein
MDVSTISAVALRLGPGQDLIEQLELLVRERGIEAACVLTCVGSLRRAVIRFADQDEWTAIDAKLEIVALTGALSRHGGHYHVALSDGQGRTIGGHIERGCLVYTTAEIVLGVLPQLQFRREHDSATGYPELVIATLPE